MPCPEKYKFYHRSLIYRKKFARPISHLVAASIIGENSDGTPIYGKIFEIADSAFQRFTNETIQKIPFHCLYCYNYPPINAFVRLENYDNVVEEFPEYGIELWNRCLVSGHKNIRYHKVITDFFAYSLASLDGYQPIAYTKRSEQSERIDIKKTILRRPRSGLAEKEGFEPFRIIA